jgi:hypothetical protein
MLTDAEYAAYKSIPDLTFAKGVDSISFYESGADQFLNELYKDRGTWKCALEHAAYLNEKHYEDHLSFRVVKYCQDFYVVERKIAEKKFGLDLSTPLAIL